MTPPPEQYFLQSEMQSGARLPIRPDVSRLSPAIRQAWMEHVHQPMMADRQLGKSVPIVFHDAFPMEETTPERTLENTLIMYRRQPTELARQYPSLYKWVDQMVGKNYDVLVPTRSKKVR